MDTWAPVVRWAHDGTGLLVADASSFTVGGTTTGRQFRITAGATDTAAHGSPDTWADAYGEIAIPGPPTGSASIGWGCWLRVADSSNCYTVQCTGDGAFTIVSVVAGTPTTLLTGSFTPSGTTTGPAVFRAEIQGDQIRGFWRGRLIGSVADSSITTPGFVSMFLRVVVSATEVEITRFEAGPLTAAYSPGVESQQAGPSPRHARLR